MQNVSVVIFLVTILIDFQENAVIAFAKDFNSFLKDQKKSGNGDFPEERNLI